MRCSVVKRVLASSMSILDYIILDAVSSNTGGDYLKDESFQGRVTSLKENDLISLNDKLTIKGKELLDKLNAPDENDFFERLHKRLQEKMVELTGRKQKLVSDKYAFLPNAIDLKNRLIEMSKRYKIEDWTKVEKILIQHVETSNKARFDKVRLIKYYVLGQNGKDSDLYAAYENFEDTQQAKKEEFDGVNL